MVSSSGWISGTRALRRSGAATVGDRMRQVGFAGLARTVVERLVEEPVTEDRSPPAETLSDLRHVLGGECEGVTATDEGKECCAELIRCVCGLERAVVAAGGGGSELRLQLATAREYLTGDARWRASQPVENWHAFRRLVACDVPPADWYDTTSMSASQMHHARLALEKKITGHWMGLIHAAAALRVVFRENAHVEVTRRAREEESRELLRTILRAWREIRDGVKAGAARWESRWATRTVGESALARRLSFGVQNEGSGWALEEGWKVRVLLTWQRLVRGGVVRRARRNSPLWLAAQQNRFRQLAQLRRSDEDIPSSSTTYEWVQEDEIMREQGVTSGAAAAIMRRQSRSAGNAYTTLVSGQHGTRDSANARNKQHKRTRKGDAKQPLEHSTPASSSQAAGATLTCSSAATLMDTMHTGRQVHGVPEEEGVEVEQEHLHARGRDGRPAIQREDRASPAQHSTTTAADSGRTSTEPKENGGNGETDATEASQQRGTQGGRDGLLVFSEHARELLEARVGGWYWTQPAHGDG